MSTRTIELVRRGPVIEIVGLTPQLRLAVTHDLSFDQPVFLRGRDLYAAKAAGKSHVQTVRHQCFSETDGGFFTNYGFAWRLAKLLKSLGYQTVARWAKGLRKEFSPTDAAVTPYWDNVRDEMLRYRQKEFLEAIVKYDIGRFDCAVGFGKSHMAGLIGLLFPKARMDVTAKDRSVVEDTLYPKLKQMLPNVGICTSKMKSFGHRIMCYTLDSLHHSDGTADILLVDECHQAGAPSAQDKLGIYQKARRYGLSATQDMRADGADKRVEGMLGPVRMKVTYAESVAGGVVVPIEVRLREVHCPFDPASGLDDDTAFKKAAYWRNEERNAIIAQDALSYAPSEQVMVSVATIEHALYLKQLLPDFELLYRDGGLDGDRYQYGRAVSMKGYFEGLGVMPKNLPLMTYQRRKFLTKEAVAGNIKKFIVTPIFKQGVDLRHLQAIVRCDGGTSKINDNQIPGRVSRIDGVKTVGFLHDYIDKFNEKAEARSRKRQATYRQLGWKEVILPTVAAPVRRIVYE